MDTARLYDYLRRVSVNNNRNWFAANRAEYDELRAQWLADLDRLVAAMTVWEPAMAHQSGAQCSYRFYRDTRFSVDKSPYKTFFSAAFCPMGKSAPYAGWYVEVGPGVNGRIYESGLYGGLWCAESAVLRKVRRAIVDNAEEFGDILSDARMLQYFPQWTDGDSLKRLPRGFSETDPFPEVLRMRHIGRFEPCDEKFFADSAWPERAAGHMSTLKPLIDFINYSIAEEL